MAKSLWQQSALALAGMALAGALAGCAAAASPVAVTPPPKAAAKPADGLLQTAKAEDLNVTLAVEPLKIGDNHLVVTVDKAGVKAVEAQIIMATMGHGQIVDLQQTAPGKFEVDTAAIDMEGRWMFRIVVTDATDASKTAIIHAVVK